MKLKNNDDDSDEDDKKDEEGDVNDSDEFLIFYTQSNIFVILINIEYIQLTFLSGNHCIRVCIGGVYDKPRPMPPITP